MVVGTQVNEFKHREIAKVAAGVRAIKVTPQAFIYLPDSLPETEKFVWFESSILGIPVFFAQISTGTLPNDIFCAWVPVFNACTVENFPTITRDFYTAYNKRRTNEFSLKKRLAGYNKFINEQQEIQAGKRCVLCRQRFKPIGVNPETERSITQTIQGFNEDGSVFIEQHTYYAHVFCPETKGDSK